MRRSDMERDCTGVFGKRKSERFIVRMTERRDGRTFGKKFY